MIVYGHRHYGHTDEIEGIGFVKTRFVHIWFVPLIPFGSIFVVDDTGDSVRGVKIPLSFKSVAFVWVRTAAVLGTLGFLVTGVMGAAGSIDAINRVIRQIQHGGVSTEAGMQLLTVGGAAGGGLCMAAVCVAVFVLVGRLFRRAGAGRRAELLEKLGIELHPVSEPDELEPDARPPAGGLEAEIV